ncbi:MAG: transposase family protein [Treponema sp.]|jgi:hypothetical protein|nr:transposase family protein [Treponema sp.]
MDIGGLAERIKEVPDPRCVWGTIRDKREAIVVIGLGTFLCGGEDGEDMEQFGLLREQEVRQLLEAPQGIPDERPVFRVFTRVKREALARRVCEWLLAVLDLHHETVFHMRHKILYCLEREQADNPKLLEGVCEADETYILERVKGRKIPDA